MKAKISSKRQITIPIELYKKHFAISDYVEIKEDKDGIKLSSAPGDESVQVLKKLMDKGITGKELLRKFETMVTNKKAIPLSEVRRVLKEAKEHYELEEIGFFGSYLKGYAGPTSDLDIKLPIKGLGIGGIMEIENFISSKLGIQVSIDASKLVPEGGVEYVG